MQSVLDEIGYPVDNGLPPPEGIEDEELSEKRFKAIEDRLQDIERALVPEKKIDILS